VAAFIVFGYGGISHLTCKDRSATEQIYSVLFVPEEQTTRATLRKSGLAQNLTGNGYRGMFGIINMHARNDRITETKSDSVMLRMIP
jgi:hypothetical protein